MLCKMPKFLHKISLRTENTVKTEGKLHRTNPDVLQARSFDEYQGILHETSKPFLNYPK